MMKTKYLPMHQFMLPHTAVPLAPVAQGLWWILSASPFLLTHFYILVEERQINCKHFKNSIKSSAVTETASPQWGRTACPQSLHRAWALLGEIFSSFGMNPNKGKNPPSPKRLIADKVGARGAHSPVWNSSDPTPARPPVTLAGW